jgi:hypothetical protein
MSCTTVRTIRTAHLVPVKAAYISFVQITLGSITKFASRHGHCDVDALGDLGYIQHIAIFCRKRQRNGRGNRAYSVHVGWVLKKAKKDLDCAVHSYSIIIHDFRREAVSKAGFSLHVIKLHLDIA